VHNTFTRQGDIDYVKNNAANQLVSFCICINANQYIENSLPPVELLKNNNCNIILGTDSIASNRGLNLLDEMKTIQKHFAGIELPEMLQWATLNGAKALQMENVYGSFEKGKKPGIILIKNAEGFQLKENSSVVRIV
jgi:cytosine/adenosine deaminase-related metal-dependent hydrolase